MDESSRRVVKFLEKEIKTYEALSLFLVKNGTTGRASSRSGNALTSPAFYKERMKEAKKLVSEIAKPD